MCNLLGHKYYTKAGRTKGTKYLMRTKGTKHLIRKALSH
ncbi:hypothetical protein LINGRAHAP2_LOCUS21106 [Linum grandiflorum]